MKRLPFGFALGACMIVAMPVQALHLSDDGHGQVLLFPYYTVNGGNQTLISVVNTTRQGKAARIFFREGRNSRIALELSVYLGPYDVWTASVFSREASAAANLLTVDNTCTVPALKRSTTLPVLSNGNRYIPFSNAAFTGSANDSGPDDLARTREGHFELIEMGEVTDASRHSLSAITQDGSGMPANCLQIERAWSLDDGYWRLDPGVDLAPPGGGLIGTVYYVDALNGTMQSIAADAVDDFSASILHSLPGQGQPTLASANTGTAGTSIAAEVFVDGEPLTLQFPLPAQSIDAVSAVLMADSIHNEFVTGASVGGVSEWVVTFPTKHFYTDIVAAPAVPPFESVFPAGGDQGGAPVEMSFAAWSRAGWRERCIPPYDYVGCPLGVPPPNEASRLNWASNVLVFNPNLATLEQDAILDSALGFYVEVIPTLFGRSTVEGAMRISFLNTNANAALPQHRLRPDTQGRRLRGLPVQGFWIASYTNGAVTPGVLANYSDAVRHQGRASLSSELQ